MKKGLTILATMILTVSISTYDVDAKSNVGENTNEIITAEEILEDERTQKEIENYLVKELGENYKSELEQNEKAVSNAQSIEKNFEKNEKGDTIYPDYFGGMYINEDNQLVIQIIKNKVSTSNTEKYSKLTNGYSNTNLEYVKYSYQELNKIHDEILDYFLNDNKSVVVTGLYVDVLSNNVVVELKEKSEETIELFKEKVNNSPMIRFEKGQNFETITNLNPGASYGNCSFAYRARLSGKNGIVTAAHCVSSGQSLSFGTVKKWQRSGSIDAAWIETNSSNTPTNTLAQKPPFSNITTIATNVVTSFYSGQRVAKLGGTTGFTVGSVTNGSYSVTVDGIAYTNLVRANLVANSGDSGGIVIDQNAILGSSGYYTAGVVTAKSSTSGTDMLFTKASQVNSIFGLTRY